MSEQSVYQQLRGHLTYLRLTAAAEALAPELEHASTEKLSHSAFLARLLGVEVASTEERRLAGRRRFACLPAPWHLGDFDFEAQPRLDRKLIDELATLRFVEEAANVLFIGPARRRQDGLWPSRGRVDSWPSRKSPRSSLAAHLRRLVKEHRGQPITLRARVQLRPVRWRTLAPLGQLPAPAP